MESNLPANMRGNSWGEEKEEAALEVMGEAEKAKAVQQVQAQFVIAKRFPRDETRAIAKIGQSCKRSTLAEKACYAYPKGDSMVRGPSIKLIRVIAQQWGNLDCGIRELDRGPNYSLIEAYAIDLESNHRETKTFTVPHTIRLKSGKDKPITDPREIYEHIANMGSRRMRACIQGVVPADVVDQAVEWCNETLRAGSKLKPLIDRIRTMVIAFQEIGVTKEMLEKRMGHKAEESNEATFEDLRDIYTSIKDGETARERWFQIGDPTATEQTEKLKEELAKPQATPTSKEQENKEILKKQIEEMKKKELPESEKLPFERSKK